LRTATRPRDFAAKLRLTAAALGCDSQKALDAAFRAADPNTAFDLARSYKWIQGRSLPRSPRLYAEWARLLDTGHTADWLLACDLDAFVLAVASRYGLSPDALRERVGAAPATRALEPRDSFMCGAYATYTRAQSPHFAGRLLRGSIVIVPAPRPADGMVATLVQHFAGMRAAFEGPALVMGSGLALQLRSTTGTLAPAFCALFRPTPPASLLAGMICSYTALHPGTQPPYATRILAVRVPDAAADTIEASNRYLDLHEDPGRDLAALGLPIAEAADLPARLAAWVQGDKEAGAVGTRLSPEEYAELVAACDRLWISALTRAA